MRDSFKNVSATENNPKWNNIISRKEELYSRKNDIRSEFERDYTRIIHSLAYRRMKHKTQVFFLPENDHICTRAEHVVLVESIAYTIAKYLGLNTELTKAIATAHDIGHSPFGHQGERILSKLSQEYIGKSFWHERNGMEIIDKIELLEAPDGMMKNLDLTYAVRDGIISHCGEIDENSIKPREEFIDLDDYKEVNQYAPYTWEGCVVKVSDKIAYLGRDISDAISMGILDRNLEELYTILGIEHDKKKINNTVLINDFIQDLCENSSPEKGLCFSKETFETIKKLKEFNYKNIYFSPKLQESAQYFMMVLNNIFNILKLNYTEPEKAKSICANLVEDFEKWLKDYSKQERNEYNKNKALFDINNETDYIQAIIYYISGMTDNYAIRRYNQIIQM